MEPSSSQTLGQGRRQDQPHNTLLDTKNNISKIVSIIMSYVLQNWKIILNALWMLPVKKKLSINNNKMIKMLLNLFQPDRNQVLSRLNQIRDYVKQTSALMDSLRGSSDPVSNVTFLNQHRPTFHLYILTIFVLKKEPVNFHI